ncbi:MAG: DEAD/DEAH box helicase [Selenomonadales bacterium]|jgi:superfamily II DNA/RNA helicase|nr:DEAD/DEAH box helicase [Selenomonadales bacterium]MBQ2246254.1 DEAD/DEAH box helicase [Selenomonadales bacterium]MBQ5587016.1 DEAD/DEAH box helicase [Selenomonadales bacterium]MBQ5833132.1 DEAD/DEAH box helicase [Selenomonadales bacterium]MBR0324729.1 DEAD/DEAH box helicase [Selenomonadales bacterium]
MTFQQLGIASDLIDALKTKNITEPTQIQKDLIPLIKEGKNAVGCSATGTGKTLSYLLPIMEKVDPEEAAAQVVILAPTNELVMQIQREAEALAAASGRSIRTMGIAGSANIARQIDRLKTKPHIIVASPGRLFELLGKRKVSVFQVKTLVLDEVDRLLDDQLLPSVEKILKAVPKQRQMIFVSATITDGTRKKVAKLCPDITEKTVASTAVLKQQISHSYIVVDHRRRLECVRKLYHALELKRTILFVNRSYDIPMIVEKLNHHKIKTTGLYREMMAADRKKALADFARGTAHILVATDVAARGLDIQDVDCIINLYPPENEKVYLHRAGRTARAGGEGRMILLVTDRDRDLVASYERKLPITLTKALVANGKWIEKQPK